MKGIGITLMAALLAAFPLLAHSAGADIDADSVYLNYYNDYPRACRNMHLLRQNHTYPEWQLNLIEGDLYFDNALYFDALRYYQRVAFDETLADSVRVLKSLQWRMALSRDGVCNNPLLVFCGPPLSNRDTYTEAALDAMLTYFSGREEHMAGHQQRGYELMRQGIEQMKQSADREKLNRIYYLYMNMVELQQYDRLNHEALGTLAAMEEYMHAEAAGEASEFRHPQAQKDMNAHKAVLLNRVGRVHEADSCYQLFKSLGDEQRYDYFCIVPYWRERGLPDDMLHYARLRYDHMVRRGLLRSYEGAWILGVLAEGHAMKGLQAEASRLFHEQALMADTLRQEAVRNGIIEQENNYRLFAQELQMERKLKRSQRVFFLILAAVIALAAGLIVWRERRERRRILRKNQAMAETIADLMHYKQQLLALRKATLAGNRRQEDSPANSTELDDAWYEKLRHALIDEQLYLNPDLSRDMLLERLGIPKNSFSQLFQTHTGMSYTHYVNGLRLDHAVMLMREHPNHTIDAVAADSGFASVTTLYRLFSQKYGMTPAEYRAAMRSK